jgi:hypothetical protein
VVLGRQGLAPSLHRLGISYVLLFKEADWRAQLPLLIGLAPVLDTPDLRMYRAPPASVPTFPHPPFVPVLAGDVVTLGVVAVAGLRLLRRR